MKKVTNEFLVKKPVYLCFLHFFFFDGKYVILFEYHKYMDKMARLNLT